MSLNSRLVRCILMLGLLAFTMSQSLTVASTDSGYDSCKPSSKVRLGSVEIFDGHMHHDALAETRVRQFDDDRACAELHASRREIASAHARIGRALRESGRVQEPKLAVALDLAHFGVHIFDSGLRDDARSIWRTALRIENSHDTVPDRLDGNDAKAECRSFTSRLSGYSTSDPVDLDNGSVERFGRALDSCNRGDLGQAITILRAVQQTADQFFNPQLVLGDLLYVTGDRQGARSAWLLLAAASERAPGGSFAYIDDAQSIALKRLLRLM